MYNVRQAGMWCGGVADFEWLHADWNFVAETKFWYMECGLSGGEGARVSAGA